MLAIAALYGYGATTTINVAFDTGNSQSFQPRVIDKRVYSSSNGDIYYLTLNPWGPIKTKKEFKVSYNSYATARKGAPATVLLWPGQLGVPWFIVCGDSANCAPTVNN